MKKIVTLSLFFLTSVSVFAMEEDKELIYIKKPQPLSASQQVLLRALRETARVRLTFFQETKEEMIGLYEALQECAPLGTSSANALKILVEKGHTALLTGSEDQLERRRNFAVGRLKWVNSLPKKRADGAALVAGANRVPKVLVEVYQNLLEEALKQGASAASHPPVPGEEAPKQDSMRPLTSAEQQDVEMLTQHVADDLFDTPAAIPLKTQIRLTQIRLKFSHFITGVMNDPQVGALIPGWRTITSADGFSLKTMAQLSQVAQAHFPVAFGADTLAEFGSVWQGPPALLETSMLSFYRKYAQLEIECILRNFLENPALHPMNRTAFLQRVLVGRALLSILDAEILQLKEKPAAKSVLPAYVETILKKQRDRLQDILFGPGMREGIDFSATPRMILEKEAEKRRLSFNFEAYAENLSFALPEMRAAIKADRFLETNLNAFREEFAGILSGLSKEYQRDSEAKWVYCFSGPKAGVVYPTFKSRDQNPAAFEAIKKDYGWEESILVSFVRETSVQVKKDHGTLMDKPKNWPLCPAMAEKILFYEALVELLDENIKARFTGEVLQVPQG